MYIEKSVELKNMGKTPFFVEHFNSIHEMAFVIRNREHKKTQERWNVEKDVDDGWEESFFGVSNMQEAYDFLEKGAYKDFDKDFLNITQVAENQGVDRIFRDRNNVVGHSPIVPLAIMNIPQCMRETVRVPVKRKVLNVVFDTGCAGKYSAKKGITAGLALFKALYGLELKGYRISLKMLVGFWGGTNKSGYQTSADIMTVNVKNDKEPFDFSRVAFPLIHPGFFRVFGFSWIDKTSSIRRHSLGQPVPYAFEYCQEDYQKYMEAVIGQKDVICFNRTALIEGDTEKYIRKVFAKGGIILN